MTHIKTNLMLRCGCCGEDFATWQGYQDQDQDHGYGVCKKCQVLVKEHYEADWNKAIEAVDEGLYEVNRRDFRAMNREEKKDIIRKLLADGFLTYSLNPTIITLTPTKPAREDNHGSN
ncbi:MAG: hypothetical protein RPR28_06370 [Cycloclasticus sp.]